MTEAKPPAKTLADLKPKAKPLASASILALWVTHAEKALDVPAAGGRMGWLVASTVVIAALQRAVDSDGTPRFLLKGGTYLQHRLGRPRVPRATSTVLCVETSTTSSTRSMPRSKSSGGRLCSPGLRSRRSGPRPVSSSPAASKSS